MGGLSRGPGLIFAGKIGLSSSLGIRLNAIWIVCMMRIDFQRNAFCSIAKARQQITTNSGSLQISSPEKWTPGKSRLGIRYPLRLIEKIIRRPCPNTWDSRHPSIAVKSPESRLSFVFVFFSPPLVISLGFFSPRPHTTESKNDNSGGRQMCSPVVRFNGCFFVSSVIILLFVCDPHAVRSGRRARERERESGWAVKN